MTKAIVDDGMMTLWAKFAELAPANFDQLPLAGQRLAWDDVCARLQQPRPPGVAVQDVRVDEIDVRIYQPETRGVKPGVIYAHGGGWVFGSLTSHDEICATLSAQANVVLVVPDYRLAPEHSHPAQLEDMLKILLWMRHEAAALGIDEARIMAAGDSAGGQLVAGMALTLQAAGVPQLGALALFYPALNGGFSSNSFIQQSHAPGLSAQDMEFYWQSYLGPKGTGNWQDPRAIPMLAPDVSGLPPTFISVAGFDPLHDDGVLFHDKLTRAGVAVQLQEEPTLTHSYLRGRHHSPVAAQAFARIVQALHSLAYHGKLPV